MWNKEQENNVAPSSSSNPEKDLVAFVGKGVTVKGTVTYSGTVRVDGRVDGEVQTDGSLIVGDGAEIVGTVHAGSVVCRGTITGDIIAAQAVKLYKPAVLEGTIDAPIFSIEEGVRFNGTCAMADQVRKEAVVPVGEPRRLVKKV